MKISFQPITPTSQDDFNVLADDLIMGTFKWVRNHVSKDNCKPVALVYSRHEGMPLICPSEKEAIAWLMGLENEALESRAK